MAVVADFNFDIDQRRLDQEWLRQPGLAFYWNNALADAKRVLEQARRELDLTKSEIERAVRDDPAKFGMPKVTEAAIAAIVIEQPEHAQAFKGWLDAKHSADVISAACVAIEHRKRALENLVDLHGQSYFSTPVAAGHSADDLDEKRKEAIRTRRETRKIECPELDQ